MVQKLTNHRITLIEDLIKQIENMQNKLSNNTNQIREIDKKIADLISIM